MISTGHLQLTVTAELAFFANILTGNDVIRYTPIPKPHHLTSYMKQSLHK